MNILKVKTLICFQNQKEQWNVTNLAVTLGEEKYAVSRVLTVLEKEGLIDKSNRRKPILTKKGKMAAEAYSQKVELVIGHLLSTGVSQEVAREDAVTIASYCKEETLEALKKEEIAKRVKYGFREGMEFDGERLSILNIQNKNGKLYLRMLEEYREYEFAYWDGQAWCEMERQGKLLAFRADKIRFQSIAGEKGRMLSGRIWIQIFDGDDAKELLFAVYIA